MDSAGQSGGLERVPAPKKWCWVCGRPAVCGAKSFGWRRKVRALCADHAEALLGPADPAPWEQINRSSQRDLCNEWLRALTIFTHSNGQSLEQIMDEIRAVNQPESITVRLATPLPADDQRKIAESAHAVNILRSRETLIHMAITVQLVRWLSEATGRTQGDIIQDLALVIDRILPEEDP